MQEIGGYIEFEKNTGDLYHNDAIALNCGRSCLAYLIKSRKITKIKLPKFVCGSVINLCIRENVKISYYNINLDFLPVDVELAEDEWLYVVNYYGQLEVSDIILIKQKFGRIILDNAQSYYQMPINNIDTLYTCRKYFGVPDGAFLYTDSYIEVQNRDLSYDRMNFLMGRFEKSASDFYSEYVANNKLFDSEPIKMMSLLTENILRGLDYEKIKNIRTQNFSYLHNRLGKLNKLNLKVPEGAFMYPLYLKNGASIRVKLQKELIYIPTLWPSVYKLSRDCELEYDLAENILPLPVDQRYDEATMKYVSDRIMEIIENE